MNTPTAVELNVLCIALIVLFWVFYGFRNIWNLPLRHGHGFFLGVEVSPGFYEGPGISWLKSYRALVVALHSVWAVALGAIVVSGAVGYDRLVGCGLGAPARDIPADLQSLVAPQARGQSSSTVKALPPRSKHAGSVTTSRGRGKHSRPQSSHSVGGCCFAMVALMSTGNSRQ